MLYGYVFWLKSRNKFNHAKSGNSLPHAETQREVVLDDNVMKELNENKIWKC